MPKRHNTSVQGSDVFLKSKNERERGYLEDTSKGLSNNLKKLRPHVNKVITKNNDMTNQLNVMVVEVQGFFLDCLVSFLKAEGNFNVMTTNNVASAIKAIDAKGPFDLIIQNFDRPWDSKLDDFKQLLNHNGGQNIALMCGAECNSIDEEALQQEGTVGFIPRTMPLRNLIKVLQFIATGQRYAPPEFIIAENVKSRFSLAQRLSHREFQILVGIARGQTNNDIACDLGLKEPTIKAHVKKAFRKLYVGNRTQAALIARKYGIY